MSFASSMEAKDFLVSRIVEEARHRHTGLSALERKMMYFSEGYPTLPDMLEVNAEFEAQCDDEKYEKKIRKLSRKAFEHDREQCPEIIPLWREAISLLKKEDHYLLVMLDVPKSVTELAKLFIAGTVMAIVVIIMFAESPWIRRQVSRIPDSVDFLIIFFLFAAVSYVVYQDKAKELGRYLSKLARRLVNWI